MGREADIEWTLAKLSRQSPESCNLVGEPGIGKTSTLYQVYNAGIEHLNCTVFVWLRLSELPLPLQDSLDFWLFLLSKLLAEIKEREGPTTSSSGAPDQLDEMSAYRAIDNAISTLCTKTPPQRVVLLIDNAEYMVAEDNLPYMLLDRLRSLLTRNRNCLALVITSTDSIHSLYESRFSGKVSPLARIMHTRHLGLLGDSDARRFIAAAAQAEGASSLIDNVDVTFLLREAGRYPDFLKTGFQHLLNHLHRSELRDRKRLHEDVCLDFRSDERVRYLFQELLRRRKDEEVAVLCLLAEGIKAKVDRVILRDLKKSGLVEDRHGDPVPFSDALRYWLQRPGWLAEIREPSLSDRMSAILHRTTQHTFEYLQDDRAIRVDGKTIRLTSLENRLLHYFWAHADRVLESEELLANVWGPGPSKAVVERAVNRLRAKVEEEPERPSRIVTAKGQGYIFVREQQ